MADKDYSDETARIIDEEVKRLGDEAYAEAERILEANWEKVVAISEALLRYETLQKDDIDRIMRGEALEKATVADLLNEEAKKSDKTPPPEKPLSDDRPDEDLGGIMPQPV
jgi:cell division protease FtsH